ncbi:hypothetical protein P9X10_00625 [Bacillus cereus]|nr:hypothetical protein [Bacillus cereus]
MRHVQVVLEDDMKQVSLEEVKDFASKNNMWRGFVIPITDGGSDTELFMVIHALPFTDKEQFVVTMERDLKEMNEVNKFDKVSEPLDQVIYTLDQFVEQFTGNESDSFELWEEIK